MFMNKLLLRSHICIDCDGRYILDEWDSSDVTIDVLDGVCCELLFVDSNSVRHVEVHISQNAKVFCQMFFVDVQSKFDFFLEASRADLELVCSMVASKKSSIHEHVYHNSSDTNSILYNSIVNYGNDLASIQVDARVPRGNVGCVLKQDNKVILIDDGKGKILPNLWIDEFDCFAEHAAYISKFSKQDLFYLQSRGIPKEDAYFLLAKSLLLGKCRLSDEMRTKFIEIIQSMRG